MPTSLLETETHIYFWGDYLSNFAKASFVMVLPGYGLTRFKCSEQAYMALKAITFMDTDILEKILMESNPYTIKALGRQIANFSTREWNLVSFDHMYNVCVNKFWQNLDLRDKLLSTGNKILVEGAPNDRIWGVGLAWNDPKILDEKNWLGQNNLGKVLMKVRTHIRECL